MHTPCTSWNFDPLAPSLAPGSWTIYFDRGETHPNDRGMAALLAAAAWLQRHPDHEVQVVTHANLRTTHRAALRLAQARASAVHRSLLGLGMPASAPAVECRIHADSTGLGWRALNHRRRGELVVRPSRRRVARNAVDAQRGAA